MRRLFFPLCLLLLAACQREEALPGDPADFPLAEGSFTYVVEGDLAAQAEGVSFFYRAGDDVVIYLGERDDSIRLELAYQETQPDDLGAFPPRQEVAFGGYIMKYQNGEENYWQQAGELVITYASPDTIEGRMDRLELATPSGDSLKVIEITGRFQAI